MVNQSRPRNSLWQRWFRVSRGPRAVAAGDALLAESSFELLIRKEISRCLRRPGRHSFAVVQTSLGVDQLQEEPVKQLVSVLRERGRITDELGSFRAQVSLLLPETDREGARIVANHVLRLAALQGMELETEIFVFPEDDSVFGQHADLSSDESTVEESSGDRGRTDRNGQTHPEQVPSKLMRAVVNESEKRLSDSSTIISRIGDAPTVLPTEPTPLLKRAVDVVGSGLGLLLCGPAYLLIAAWIRWDSPGPALFTQVREGKDGRLFRIYKFRTMRHDAEQAKSLLRAHSEQDGPAFKMTRDPRVTRAGLFLRKSCLDELPQLLNVFRGEMSLVGPRPLPVDESRSCEMWHRQRLSVLPGLTCVWQVYGGREVSFEQWMRMDLDYIRQRGFWLDAKLLVATFWKVIQQRGSV